ncbi:MAG TPA: hypothetical protein VJ326_00045 [Thermoplasmata archaeon]|nr:hypothetical protein [Thermoplasmata archaeon]
MSAASGIAATGIALVLAVIAIGQPVWEWRLVEPTETETWTYRLFGVDHAIQNASTNATTTATYTYYDLPGQSRMSALFIELGRWLVVSMIAGAAGLALTIATFLKKLRGIYAGVAFLGACSAALYAGLKFVFALPPAAADLPTLGQPIPDFSGQFYLGSSTLAWGPLAGWFLLLGVGLVFAWTSSDVWHVRIAKRAAPRPAAKPPTPVIVTIPTPAAPAPVAPRAPEDPVIDEVFVIAPSGLLVKHMSRSLLSDKDRDVVGGMISVVSNFVREAFTEKDGVVQEIQLGDHRFVMYNQDGLVLAALVGKGETETIVHRLRHLATLLLDRYGERLTAWGGEPLDGIEDELSVLWQPFFVPPPPTD